MWDSNSPMQLLKLMPAKLNNENLQKIQLVIDADKYKNSIVSGFDLCGIYAPFCRGCNKMSIYPCAVAYVKMMQAEGMQIEIDAMPQAKQDEEEKVETVSKAEETAKERVESEETVKFEEAVEEVAATEEEDEKEQPISQPEPQPQQVQIEELPKAKTKIRIAVAKRKV